VAHGGGLLKHKEQPGATLFFEFGHNVARPKNFWRGVDPTQSRQTVKRRDMMQERPQPGHMPVPSGSWACSALVSDPRDEVMDEVPWRATRVVDLSYTHIWRTLVLASSRPGTALGLDRDRCA
jgi:hypothetical protein